MSTRLLKDVLVRIAPRTMQVVQAIRARRLVCRLQRDWGVTRVERQFLQHYPPVVRHGPFSGMLLPSEMMLGGVISHVIGCYELELHEALGVILSRRYAAAIDVGCSTGYYAIGIARELPNADVYAFDVDPYARRACRRAAKLNGVSDRVKVSSRCEPSILRKFLARPRSLIVSDCEGYEWDLLDPSIVPELAFSDMLVELHNIDRPAKVAQFSSRFTQTHDAITYSTSSRDPSSYAALSVLDLADREIAINEFRGEPQYWLFLSTKQRASPCAFSE